jgi:hypothetical protein
MHLERWFLLIAMGWDAVAMCGSVHSSTKADSPEFAPEVTETPHILKKFQCRSPATFFEIGSRTTIIVIALTN